LRIKEEETRLTLQEHDDDHDDDELFGTFYLHIAVLKLLIFFWGGEGEFSVINLPPCRFVVREKLERKQAY